jgi:putative hydrolase
MTGPSDPRPAERRGPPEGPAEDRAAPERPAGRPGGLAGGDVLAGDHHVHSTFSDDATSTIAENVAAARERGLDTVVMTDHVRTGTTWLAEYVAAVAAVAAGSDLRVLCGVETKVLDRAGHLDLPPGLPPLDRVLIADHQYPGPDGPLTPVEVRQLLADGRLTAADVTESIVDATTAALGRTDHPQLAHLFSLLPKVGLTESAIDVDQLRRLAEAARDTGAVVEVNEKWDCPGPAAVAAFRAAGVSIVASTDSHRAADVGRYVKVREILGASGAR